MTEKGFVKFSHKKYRQSIYKDDLNQLRDPLNVMVNMNSKPRMLEILYQLEKSKEYMPNIINVGSLMYHMGSTGATNEYVFQRIEDKLIELQGTFRRRGAFGLAYGALATSRPKNIIYFGLKEYNRFLTQDKKQLFPAFEIKLLIEALHKNTNLSNDEKRVCFIEYIEPLLDKNTSFFYTQNAVWSLWNFQWDMQLQSSPNYQKIKDYILKGRLKKFRFVTELHSRLFHSETQKDEEILQKIEA